MIYLLIKSNEQFAIKSFSNDYQAKAPYVCLCDCCDIECDCSSNTPCPHHTQGEGGMCIAKKIEDTEDGLGKWERVTWFSEVVADAVCPHTSAGQCQGERCKQFYDMQLECSKRLPGIPRGAGSQRRALVHARIGYAD